jgi:hypothetical protein
MSEKINQNPERESGVKHEKLDLKVDKSAESHKPQERKSETQHEREKSVEKTREKIEKSLDKESDKSREKQPESTEVREPQVVTRDARDAAYRSTMQTVRSQLTPVQRNFSRFIHAKPVEVTSELLEETIFRPSFLWGGVIGGILMGASLYTFSYIQGFKLSGSEFIVGLLIGGVLGVIGEKLFRRKKTTKGPNAKTPHKK